MRYDPFSVSNMHRTEFMGLIAETSGSAHDLSQALSDGLARDASRQMGGKTGVSESSEAACVDALVRAPAAVTPIDRFSEARTRLNRAATRVANRAQRGETAGLATESQDRARSSIDTGIVRD